MTKKPLVSEELDMLAAGYALGLLDEADKARATELEVGNEDFAARVAQWHSLDSQWLLDAAPVPVGEHVWERLAPMFEGTQKPAEVPKRREAANDDFEDTSAVFTAARKWPNRSFFAAAASLVLAIAFGTMLAISTSDKREGLASTQLAVAQISNAQGAPLVSAAFDSDAGNLRLRVADFGTLQKAPELWVLDQEGNPFSLGVVEDREMTVRIADELRALLIEGAVIAVTLEDRETGPHDAPTGAILGTGELVVL